MSGMKSVVFDPEGMSAMSRGLSVRDTPGVQSLNGYLHPEGMLASDTSRGRD